MQTAEKGRVGSNGDDHETAKGAASVFGAGQTTHLTVASDRSEYEDVVDLRVPERREK